MIITTSLFILYGVKARKLKVFVFFTSFPFFLFFSLIHNASAFPVVFYNIQSLAFVAL